MSDYRVIHRDRRDILGEGPLWSSRQQALFWVDIKGRRLNRLSLAGARSPGDQVQSWPVDQMIGWVIERRDAPGLVAGLEHGVALIDLDPFLVTLKAAVEPDKPDNRLNDAKADRMGRVFAGTMHKEGMGSEGSLYRLDTDYSLHLLDAGYGVANGPTFSPDQKTLYHTDSVRGVVYAFDLGEDGVLSNKRDFISFAPEWGSPDGMTTDAEGGLWIAHWDGGRVSRFTPDGRIDRAITLPASRITSCTFAGEHLDRMFVTSASEDRSSEPLAGALFEVDPGVRGLPTQSFAG